MKITAGLVIAAVTITVHADSAPSIDSACPDACPAVMRPVYDDAGVMYSNECYMLAAKCKHTKQDVNILEEYERLYGNPFGASGGAQRALFSDENGDANQESDRSQCGNVMCPAVMQPVVGEDGITYSNSCVMNAQKNCKGKETEDYDVLEDYKRLYGKSFGASWDDSASSESGSDEDVPGTKFDSADDSTDGSAEVYCPDVSCLQVFSPVYDEEGNEYSNACEMNAAKCKGKRKEVNILDEYKRLYGRSFGASRDDDIEESGNPSTKGPEKCASVCPDVMLPVCGSDGVRYSNPCELKVAACQNPDLNIVQDETDSCSQKQIRLDEKYSEPQTHIILH